MRETAQILKTAVMQARADCRKRHITMTMLGEMDVVISTLLRLGWTPLDPSDHYHCSAGCEKSAGTYHCVNCGAIFLKCTPETCP